MEQTVNIQQYNVTFDTDEYFVESNESKEIRNKHASMVECEEKDMIAVGFLDYKPVTERQLKWAGLVLTYEEAKDLINEVSNSNKV